MKYCIHNTRLIIGIADRVIENGSILFDQDKILKVSAHSITDADVFIDGTTFSVLPGDNLWVQKWTERMKSLRPLANE
ncbi:hypothetical protein P4475_05410 [Halalkalibacterium halodurans]|uniref:hypothetical protein n=1 Tax=Halalkalibacterium halodurans TaxID=86665 RepID=UPI001F23E7B6|nr:hypothetical protein [Halalkalibacterium halodurans]MED3646258.1 hypothetical protein [Halalkalibacterium halodurans]